MTKPKTRAELAEQVRELEHTRSQLTVELRGVRDQRDCAYRTINEKRAERSRKEEREAQRAEAAERAADTFEAERDQARRELAEARAELEARYNGVRLENAWIERDRFKEERDEAREALAAARVAANAAAAAANKQRALLLCAARASCKRLRLRVAKWRQCAEDVIAVADDYRGRLAGALVDHQAAEDRYRRAEDQRAAAESALETLEGQATLAEERAHALAIDFDTAREAIDWGRTVHARQRRWIVGGKLRRERDRATVRRLRSERAELRAELGELTQERDQVRAHLGAAVDEHTEEAAARLWKRLELDPDGRGLELPAGWRWKTDHHGGWEIRDRAGKEIGCVVRRAADCYTWHGEGSDHGQAPGARPACLALAASLRAVFGGREETEPPAPVRDASRPGASWPPWPVPSPAPTSSPGEDLSLPPGWRWKTDHHGGWVVDCFGVEVGDVQKHREHCWSWHEVGDERGNGACGVHTDEAGARARLARFLRASFASQTPDHCSNDHASPSAFRALCTRTCSGAGDQPCTGEQSSPEPEIGSAAAFARRGIAGAVAEGLARAVLNHCWSAQPARPIRASRQARGAGRFPRGGGRPGMAEVTPRVETRKVGEMTLVAKAGPSPADRESAVNQGERARLRNTGCATGALAGGPEPSAGGRPGWFGTVGEGERVDPGGALRVAVAVLGAVDLVWWLCVRLAYLCGRRSDEEMWIGIGWNGADVRGGALCEAWIGVVPAAAEAREGWPVGWSWRTNPLEPTGWECAPDSDDRAPFEPGSVGVLVKGHDGAARLAAWATAWGDRWTAPGFDVGRLVRLLRAEITDAELRAEDPDDEDDEDDDADDADPDAPAHPDDVWRSPFCAAELPELPDLPPGYVWHRRPTALRLEREERWIGTIKNDGSDHACSWELRWYPPEGEKSTSRAPSPIEAARTLAAVAWQHERRALVADERPPATCRTGQEPVRITSAELRPRTVPGIVVVSPWQSGLDIEGVLPPLPAGAVWRLGKRALYAQEEATGEILGTVEPEGDRWTWCPTDGAVKREATRDRAISALAADLIECARQAEGGQS